MIRRATKEDRKSLLELFTAQLVEHDIAISAESLGGAIDEVFENASRGFLLVAFTDEKLVGAAYVAYIWTLEHGGKSAWLEEIYVKPEYRDRGLGQALMEELLAVARLENCKAVDLEVEAEHTRAANLYRRNGFLPHRRARWVYPIDSPVRPDASA